MTLRFFTMNRLLAPIDGDGSGDGGGGSAGGEAPPSFDSAMTNVFAEAKAQLDASGQNPSAPTGEAPSGGPAAGAAPVAPAAGGTPEAAPQYLSLDQGRAIVQQWQQTQQQLNALTQMMARNQQPQPEAPKPAVLSRPSTLDLAKTFIEPRPQQGETQAAFEERRSAMLLDHFNHAAMEYAEKHAAKIVEDRFAQYEARQQAQVQRAEGERRYTVALGDAVAKGGFAAGTPVATWVQQVAHNAIVARANSGERFNDASLTAAMGQEIARAKQFLVAAQPAAPAPVAGQPIVQGQPARAPNGQFTTQPAAPAKAAPIAGAGGTGANVAPPQGTTPKATTFEGAMDQVFSRANREMGNA